MNLLNVMDITSSASPSTASRGRRGRSRGFSLIELLLAIFILGVGVISISAVFPAGIVQQRRAQDDVLGPVIAEAALSTIRSKVGQSDFGTFEEFGIYTPATFAALDGDFPNTWLRGGDEFTQRGDWPWLRPSMAVVPAGVAADSRDYFGDIDIFSARVARGSVFAPEYPGISESRLADRKDHRTAVLQWFSGDSGTSTPAVMWVDSSSEFRSIDRSSTSSETSKIRWSPSLRKNGSGRPDPGTRPVEIDRSTPGTACSVGSRGGSRLRSSSTG